MFCLKQYHIAVDITIVEFTMEWLMKTKMSGTGLASVTLSWRELFPKRQGEARTSGRWRKCNSIGRAFEVFSFTGNSTGCCNVITVSMARQNWRSEQLNRLHAVAFDRSVMVGYLTWCLVLYSYSISKTIGQC
jgi:hypothetical protein